jgi:hypothetical protein
MTLQRTASAAVKDRILSDLAAPLLARQEEDRRAEARRLWGELQAARRQAAEEQARLRGPWQEARERHAAWAAKAEAENALTGRRPRRKGPRANCWPGSKGCSRRCCRS